MDEVKRVAMYIRSCRSAGIDCVIAIDKSRTHLILNALEKQIPKKPKIIKHSGCRIYECPNCLRPQKISYFQCHCTKCGQAIDWSDE